MKTLMTQLLNDDNGFIVSAELVLVTTIAVLSMVVGLSEVANNVTQELEDVGAAFGSINQSFGTCGYDGHHGWTTGSNFRDHEDFCDGEYDIESSRPRRER